MGRRQGTGTPDGREEGAKNDILTRWHQVHLDAQQLGHADMESDHRCERRLDIENIDIIAVILASNVESVPSCASCWYIYL